MTKDVNVSEAAAAMGRVGGSRPKNYSPEELKRRTARVHAGHAAWLKKQKRKKK